VTEPRVAFLSFAAIRIAVSDLGAAVSAWREQLGWSPDTVSADGASFPLDGAVMEMVPAAAGQPPGVTAVAVTVDDTEAAAQRIRAAGFRAGLAADGTVVLPGRDLNGVALELRDSATDPPRNSAGPFTRIRHVVVAVEDDDAARRNWARAFGPWPAHSMDGREHAQHVPAGAAWFGLTAAGTDAGALRRFLGRRGEGVYAVSLIAGDWPRTLESLRRNGARLIVSADSGQTFVHPASTHGVLIEVAAG
jgi:Glyoxalase/Bleomycin resistance protein/Dioxygenase superfamily